MNLVDWTWALLLEHLQQTRKVHSMGLRTSVTALIRKVHLCLLVYQQVLDVEVRV